MRQQESTSEDDMFRMALVNMRHRRCTEEDLQFLKSLVVARNEKDSVLADPEYRHVSIITGLNAQRDPINAKGCEKFAEDTGQELHEFHAVDHIGQGDDDPGARKRKGRKRWIAGMKEETRNLLWSLTHYSSENVPGVLRLCKGMPVIIKKNQATELGVTNGGEGIVVDWISRPVLNGKQALDVLFVELTNNKASVQVEGLPPNVVPVCAETDNVECELPSGALLTIRRTQVRVLPNFAMTDFASQGKTRERNVVDLSRLRGHQACYTALSRSACAAKTVIIRDFSTGKLRGGLSPHLLAEYRDLEILDDMTRLEFEGTLPTVVNSTLRYARIAQFLKTQPRDYLPPNMHPTLKWSAGDLKRKSTEQIESIPSKKKRTTAKNRQQPKHVRAVNGNLPPVGNAVRTAPSTARPVGVANAIPRPVGLKWDSINYSCAYDALFTALYHAWLTNTQPMSRYMRYSTPVLSMLLDGFIGFAEKKITFEGARDRVRAYLHSLKPNMFKYGREGCVIQDLTEVAMDSPVTRWVLKVKCGHCGNDSTALSVPARLIIVPDARDSERYLKQYLLEKGMPPTCCEGFPYRSDDVTIIEGPYMFGMTADFHASNMPITTAIDGNTTAWRLASVIYYGDFHFVMRHIDPQGSIWYHDGMKEGGTGSYDGKLNAVDRSLLSSKRGSNATVCNLTVVLYTRER
ncbi:hypothetical protein EXIGLDRAFT_602926 [Exidia glandulosa HHB12029]|uniref:Uncharacterized protein n=1 Tax=Exidia glandulosa HHB12029 TaxID=1314781 RepID=A0A166BJ99_EXIGL|nr:hypothetical protein EXIGLDRAFT_602926 [Exidia glandulosa HHB12029]